MENKKLEILVVEDFSGKEGEDYLEECKYVTSECGDAYNLKFVSRYEDALNELENHKYDGIICDLGFPAKEENYEKIKTEIEKNGNKERLKDFAKRVKGPKGESMMWKPDFGERMREFNVNKYLNSTLKNKIESPHAALGPLIGLKAKEKQIPYVFVTDEIFHASDSIPMLVYLGLVNINELVENLNNMNAYSYNKEKYLIPGYVLTSELVVGWKAYANVFKKAVELLEKKISK